MGLYSYLKKPFNNSHFFPFQIWLFSVLPTPLEYYHHWILASYSFLQLSSVQSLSCVRLFATLWTSACQASLPITNSRSSPKPTSIESMMPSKHLILCCPFSCPQSFPASGSFQRVRSSHQVGKVLEFQLQHQSFQWTPRTDLL